MSLGRLFGINIRIDLSWLFVFALVVWSLSSKFGPFEAVATDLPTRMLLGILTAMLFFASILAHELAHSLTARARGIPIESITLFIFGGISHFKGEPTTAPSSAWISLVGPLASLAIGAAFFFAGALIGAHNAFGVAAGYLAFANIALGLFNLLPVFPLDGGRVLHALLWSATKDRVRATRIAVIIGRIPAWLIIVFGIDQTLRFGIGSGLWLTFIGWFLLQAGNAEALQTEISAALKGHTAAELAEPAVLAVAPNATGTQALETMRSQRARALPVLLGGQFLGIVTATDLAKISSDELGATFVTALMTRRETLKSITPESSASDILRILAESGHQQLPVIDAGGTFHGFVTVQGILRWAAFDRENLLANFKANH
jgi:Zn-dependent protease/CBS domain-containing protein